MRERDCIDSFSIYITAFACRDPLNMFPPYPLITSGMDAHVRYFLEKALPGFMNMFFYLPSSGLSQPTAFCVFLLDIAPVPAKFATESRIHGGGPHHPQLVKRPVFVLIHKDTTTSSKYSPRPDKRNTRLLLLLLGPSRPHQPSSPLGR